MRELTVTVLCFMLTSGPGSSISKFTCSSSMVAVNWYVKSSSRKEKKIVLCDRNLVKRNSKEEERSNYQHTLR